MKKIKLATLLSALPITASAVSIIATGCNNKESKETQDFTSITWNDESIYPDSIKKISLPKGTSQEFKASEFKASDNSETKYTINKISATSSDSSKAEITEATDTSFKVTAKSVSTNDITISITVEDTVQGKKGTGKITVTCAPATLAIAATNVTLGGGPETLNDGDTLNGQINNNQTAIFTVTGYVLDTAPTWSIAGVESTAKEGTDYSFTLDSTDKNKVLFTVINGTAFNVNKEYTITANTTEGSVSFKFKTKADYRTIFTKKDNIANITETTLGSDLVIGTATFAKADGSTISGEWDSSNNGTIKLKWKSTGSLTPLASVSDIENVNPKWNTDHYDIVIPSGTKFDSNNEGEYGVTFSWVLSNEEVDAIGASASVKITVAQPWTRAVTNNDREYIAEVYDDDPPMGLIRLYDGDSKPIIDTDYSSEFSYSVNKENTGFNEYDAEGQPLAGINFIFDANNGVYKVCPWGYSKYAGKCGIWDGFEMTFTWTHTEQGATKKSTGQMNFTLHSLGPC